MTRPTWNEITARAARFAADWKDEWYEKGEAQSFWTELLAVFGIDRRRAGGYFEYAVKLAGNRHGYVDMFLPGKLLVEQKSAGRDLGAAQTQALGYLDGVPDIDLPIAIVASDFQTFQLLDLDSRQVWSFRLEELAEHVRLFGFLVDEAARMPEEQSPVNRDAAERMAALHEALYESGFTGRRLELFLMRLVFCQFADDANIFEKGEFEAYLQNRTSYDGSDLGPRLSKLFEVLNTPPEERSTMLDEDLKVFPYINGGLFSETTTVPDFDSSLRHQLLLTCRPDWSKVSPAIFGSMFQGVMDVNERHSIGAHYTSEENILRLIQPLFLDSLYAEYEAIPKNKNRIKALNQLHDKIARLGFLDPACGCGNFLVIAYRELRKLEHRIVADIQGDRVILTDVGDLLKVRVEQFSGIELLEFPAMIARTALWLTDHQMNLEASHRFGRHYSRIPLTDGAHIVRGNALTLDWQEARSPENTDYILGNPPFLGSRSMSVEQKSELRTVGSDIRESGFLDFVAAWYILAGRFADLNPNIEIGFVSTNSIAQGEQPGIFWPPLFADGFHINFAHQTFVWTNEARGVAHVHCVIIGFSQKDRPQKEIYSYEGKRGEPILEVVDKISPYLVRGTEIVVRNRQTQISDRKLMSFGNMPADGGNLLLTPEERDELIRADPAAERWILPYVGAREFISGQERYCLWLDGISATELRGMPQIYQRVAAVRKVREKSARPRLADTPHLFAQITQRPNRPFLLIPGVSSERRKYVPMGFYTGGVIASNACFALHDASLTDFALLTSQMHMDWLRAVGGRLKSDLRYSKDVVYNNFVFPDLRPSDDERLTSLGQAVLDQRAQHPTETMAALYDPMVMPIGLARAHQALDAFVDRLYAEKPFEDSSSRVSYLLDLVARVDASKAI
ncbi:DNA methyltransferase [Microbacterium sp. W4I20]|uniref:class I SAM-dependent DNA methyltransferase n=1 Tax=Microbacterium sp. W4I20 TaxID=3042262 RepID=UPI002786CBEE|nr:DNA methyltransferase [Microbacterium sp. W4I20]MDQ0727251.1 hypothetical protein [Microbacterium sp. W4I20]